MENMDSTDRSQDNDYDDGKPSASPKQNDSLNADLKVLELGSRGNKEIRRRSKGAADAEKMKQLQERERIKAQE